MSEHEAPSAEPSATKDAGAGRGANRLAAGALALGILGWAFFGAGLFSRMIFGIAFMSFMLATAGTYISVLAVMRAVKQDLKRSPAVAALTVSALCLLVWINIACAAWLPMNRLVQQMMSG